MVASIVSQRIPRVKIGNRPIAVPTQRVIAGGGAASGNSTVGDIRLATTIPTTPTGSEWERVDIVPTRVLPVAGYAALVAAQGVRTGSVKLPIGPVVVASRFMQTRSTDTGFTMYAMGYADGIIYRRTWPNGTWAVAWTNAGMTTPRSCMSYRTPSRLFMVTFEQSTPTLAGIDTIRVSDDTHNFYTSSFPLTAINDISEGNGWFIWCGTNGIRRSNNPIANANWTTISTNINANNWKRAIYIGTTWYLFADAGVIARSLDDGATWTVTTGIAGLSGATINGRTYTSGYSTWNVVYDPGKAKLYMQCNDGTVRSGDANNPMAAWTTELTGTGGSQAVMMHPGPQGNPVIYPSNQAGPINWWTTDGKGAWKQWTSPVFWAGAGANALYVRSIWDFGDGLITFDGVDSVSAGELMSQQFADLVNTTDRLTIADPGQAPLLPFMRLK